jgi:hypothetical protein
VSEKLPTSNQHVLSILSLAQGLSLDDLFERQTKRDHALRFAAVRAALVAGEDKLREHGFDHPANIVIGLDPAVIVAGLEGEHQ